MVTNSLGAGTREVIVLYVTSNTPTKDEFKCSCIDYHMILQSSLYELIFTVGISWSYHWFRVSRWISYLTKMSQLAHSETIHTLGMDIGNVVHEQNLVKLTSLTRFRMLVFYFKNP